jgi:predicted alpha/beta-hydrolase family hydrolase
MPASELLLIALARSKSAPVLLLTHGAGAPMDSPFLDAMTKAVVARGASVVRFEFGYMAARRGGGRRRPPPKMPVLMDEYRAAVKSVRTQLPRAALVIGGKSMGGRVASMVAEALHMDGEIGGCVCLGYPFHPPRKPTALRTAHLTKIRCPTLIVQGERDALGDRDAVTGYDLSGRIEFCWLPDGDHDFKPRAASGASQQSNIDRAADAVAAFSFSVVGPSAFRPR